MCIKWPTTIHNNTILIWWLYHVCFENTDSLPGDDDDDTGDISTFDMEATDDEVAEIFRKQVTWLNGIMSDVFS